VLRRRAVVAIDALGWCGPGEPVQPGVGLLVGQFPQQRLELMRDSHECLASMADLHDRHAAAVPIGQFLARLLEDFEGQHGRSRSKVEHPGEIPS
jgi:hypothetical protein